MEKRRIKVTNKQQMAILLEFVEHNLDICRRNTECKSKKNEVKKKWDELSEELNCLGPPFRTGKEWQRVWINLKAKTKQKVINNRRSVLATDGGPSEEVLLSPLEEAVTQLVKMEWEAMPEEQIFGIEPEAVEEKISEIPKTSRQKGKSAQKKRMMLLKEHSKTQKMIYKKIAKLEKTYYNQFLLSKEKFEFEKRKTAKEEELLNLEIAYKKKKIAKLEGEMAGKL